jgi:hypothetical protein
LNDSINCCYYSHPYANIKGAVEHGWHHLPL